jgi:hypothetical protein
MLYQERDADNKTASQSFNSVVKPQLYSDKLENII